ncbi:ArfGAP with FG repeats 1, partial [Modicella reniformis]
ILAGLLKLPENKKCFDCPSKVNVYANLFNHTFICEKCSGLHRELNHRVKSISASTFTPEEVSSLQKGGNGVAKGIWLATWSWREYPEPDAHEVDEVRQFMRAKYVKKQWYRDSNGNTAPESQTSLHSPSTSISLSSVAGSSTALSVPDRVFPFNKSQSADSLNMSTFSVAPERTLSRKSSTISSDSGSTTFSKSTNLSSAASSPFNAAGSKSPKQQHHQQPSSPQQNAPQYQAQASFDDFARLMSTGNNTDGNMQVLNPSVLGSHAFVGTPAAIDNSDPFSLMTNAFSNMGMDSQQFGTMTPGGLATSNVQLPFSQQLSMSSSSDFFATFSAGAGSTSSYTSGTIESNDPFSLTMSRPQMQHQSQSQSQPLPNNSPHGLDFTSSVGVGTGAKSFDDYLQAYQPSTPSSLSPGNVYGSLASFSPTSGVASVPASLSPQSTGGSNPFSIQQQQPREISTTDFSQSSTVPASGQQSNPFAFFAKQQQPTTPNHLNTAPFGRGLVIASQQDYFSTPGSNSSIARSPNPFAMAAGHTGQSPFEQQQQQQPMQPAFMRSISESSYSFQNTFGGGGNNLNHVNGGVGSNGFESAFSGVPSLSMTTLPPATTNSSINDMFGQWIKPSPLPANSKYPSIDGLDPFSNSATPLPTSSSASSVMRMGASTSSALSNPFSLNM